MDFAAPADAVIRLTTEYLHRQPRHFVLDVVRKPPAGDFHTVSSLRWYLHSSTPGLTGTYPKL